MEATGPDSSGLYDQYRPIVVRLAVDIKRRYRIKVDLDELVAAGFEGLLQAHESFDPTRGVTFTTFAYYRVRGAIIDNCRRLGLMRRIYRSKATFENAANEVLQQVAETAPPAGSVPQEAQWLGRCMDDLAVSFRLSQQDPETVPSPHRSPERQVEMKELKSKLAKQFDTLSGEEQTVIRRYYFEGERMADIALDFGVSISWVSRVHTRALRKLKPRILGGG